MRLLGAVLAGGIGRRFGGDKALAEIDGQSLIARVIEALAAQTVAVVVCGRDMPGCRSIPDRPAAGLGPLAGIAAALHHGRAHGFDAVLTSPCDAPFLPRELAGVLGGEGAAFLAGLPLIGLWSCALAESVDAELADPASRRSVRGWAARISAREVTGVPIANVNTREDLARLSFST